MAAIITLPDGRSLYGSTLGIGGMLHLIAEQISTNHRDLKMWLNDKADRPTPFMDFDMRGLESTHRDVFWLAAIRAQEVLIERFGLAVSQEQNAYAADCLERLLTMKQSIDAGEPPRTRNDLSEVLAFEGESINLTEIWNS